MAVFSKHSAGLSFQCAIALTPTLAIIGKFLSCSVDADFHHGDLDLDSVGVSMKDDVAILVAWPQLGGAYLQDKNTCART